MAIQRVIGFQPPEPCVEKLAAATCISNESGENPLFVTDVDAEKSWSKLVPSASFFRSMEVVGVSKDHRSPIESSQTRTIASAVTVTIHVPSTPNGCHRAETMGAREVTWMVGPRVKVLGLSRLFSSLVRWEGSGKTQI